MLGCLTNCSIVRFGMKAASKKMNQTMIMHADIW